MGGGIDETLIRNTAGGIVVETNGLGYATFQDMSFESAVGGAEPVLDAGDFSGFQPGGVPGSVGRHGAPAVDDGSIIDLMVVYTADVTNRVGNVPATIQSVVDEIIIALINSLGPPAKPTRHPVMQ